LDLEFSCPISFLLWFGLTSKNLDMIPRCFLKVLILLILFPPIVFAEDFKTVNGKEYKNATVSRVEPDGIVLKIKSGITKVYFSELPKEIQERFHYDSAQATQFNAAQQSAVTHNRELRYRKIATVNNSGILPNCSLSPTLELPSDR
jgi:hypothetical protein